MAKPDVKRSTFAIVIDASVARSAGDENTLHPIGELSRDFLKEVLRSGHRFSHTQKLLEEWNHHASRFAKTWLVQMTRMNKLVQAHLEEESQLKREIENSEVPKPIIPETLKDLHLVEGALKTDKRIASHDDKAREHFRIVSIQIPKVGDVIWINPTVVKERAAQWLASGAKERPQLFLKNYKHNQRPPKQLQRRPEKSE